MTIDNEALAAWLEPLISRLCTSTCWVKRNGRLTHLKQPLSNVKLQRHLAGPHAYGVAPITPGTSTTAVCLLDFDSHKGETPWPEMQARALDVLRAAEERGLYGVPFRSSGGAGIHLLFLWEQQQDAYSVRAALRDVLADCLLSDGTGGVAVGQVELFPKQDSVAPDGRGSMFVLPFAGQSVPLDTPTLAPLDRPAVLTMTWPMSQPVVIVQRPAAQVSIIGEVSVELSTLRTAIAAIPNSGDEQLGYPEWRNIVFALHDATDGNDEGLALAHEFSARSSKYDGAFLDERVWPYVRSERDGQKISARTILHMAREHGWVEDVTEQFEVVEAHTAESLDEEDWPQLQRNKRGAILPTMENACKALACPAMTGWRVGYDAFRDEIMRAPHGTDNWQAFTDADITALRMVFERRGFAKAPKDLVRDAIDYVAKLATFDSAILWLENLPSWDGVPRVERFLTDYCAVALTPYACAASLYVWTAMAGRVLEPGCQADMALILAGEQGIGKTSLVKLLAPAKEHYVSVALDTRDTDLARRMRGRLVGEIAELRGMRSRELEAIKDFISRTHEDWIPKYREFSTSFPRRLVFIGTTNDDEFLIDSTGNRRFLPVRVGQIDLAAIERDRLQLWAEARELFNARGVCWQDAQYLAITEHREYMVHDTWEDTIAQWLSECDLDCAAPRGYAGFTTLEVLAGALSMSAQQADRRAQMRAADAIKALGYCKVDGWLAGRKQKFWVDALV